MKANSIKIIEIYHYSNGWAFDDAEFGLLQETFVAGADTLCDLLSTGRDRFTCIFSDIKFPDASYTLESYGKSGHADCIAAKNISGRSSSEFQLRNLNKEKYIISYLKNIRYSSAKNADTDLISVKAC